MEIINIVTLALALIAIVLAAFILRKVNELLTMLRTPVVKKLSPDMNLRPSSRRPIGEKEMASRGEHNQRQQEPKRSNQQKDAREGQNGANGARRERKNNRPEQRQRRDVHQQQEKERVQPERVQTPVIEASEPIQTPSIERVNAPAEQPARRPLPPRIAPETVPPAPETPVVEADPVVVEAASSVTPEKVRYGRRNVVKLAPELSED